MAELRQLAEFISALTWEAVPQDVREAGAMQVLDTVGVAVGAQDNEQMKWVRELYDTLVGTQEIAKVWGQDSRVPVTVGAFLNGMAGHTLELDDVHTGSKSHIGTVVIPAAWAMAESLQVSGEDFLLAVICGYETVARIGMAFGVTSHRLRGWHVTSTAGTFGAAAACAKLLGLDTDHIVNALGIAGTQSFGVWAFLGDGASNKVLHPARAAQLGMEAAYLSHSGMTGAEHILEAADGGLLYAMSDAYDVSFVNRELGSRYELLYMDNKPYPCCRSTHCCIDGALAMREAYGIEPGKVKKIDVLTYEVGYLQCGVSEGSLRPVTPIDAKFSTPYCVACALLHGGVTLQNFLPEVIGEAEIQELLAKVQVYSDDEFTAAYPGHWGCKIQIEYEDGTSYSKVILDASGSVDNPLTTEQMRAKALGNLITVYSEEDAQRIIEEILAIAEAERLPIV
ncbi:MAG: MmgE/PrpD family protein [Lachnospiraceae bacterium]